MVRYKITFDKPGCIGTFSCMAANPDFWEEGKDGKAVLKGSRLNEETGQYELIIDEADYEKNLESASVCPVFVIKIEPLDDDFEE